MRKALTRLTWALLLLPVSAMAQFPFISTLSGTGGGLDSNGTVSQLNGPRVLVLNRDSSQILIAELNGQRVRTVRLSDRRTSTIAGRGYTFNQLTDGVGANAFFNFPRAFGRANDSIYYVGDFGQQAGNFGNSGLRRLNIRTGQVVTIINNGTGCNATGNTNTIQINSLAALSGAAGDTVFFSSQNCGLQEVIPGATPAANRNRVILPTNTNDPANGIGSLGTIIIRGDSLLIVDNTRGQVRMIARSNGLGRFITTGMNSPEQAQILDDTTLLVVEGGANRLVRVDLRTGVRATVVSGLNGPAGLAVTDTAFFVSETGQNRIRIINRTTLAIQPYLGTNASRIDGDARVATFNNPRSVVLAPGGTMYVGDFGSSAIRRVDTASGAVSTVTTAVSALSDLAFHNGWIYFTESARNGIFRISRYNPSTNTFDRLAGSAGLSNPANPTTFAPAGFQFDGDSANSRLKFPSGIAINSTGTRAYFGSSGGASEGGHAIRVINLTTKQTTTLAGAYPTIEAEYIDGNGLNARFNNPIDVALQGDTLLYIADNGNDRIRTLNLNTGAVRTLAGSGSGVTAPVDNANGLQARIGDIRKLHLDTANNYLYFTDGNTLRRVTLGGTNPVVTVAGATATGMIDAWGTGARFFTPSGIATDSTGRNLFIADAGNGRIRKGKLVVNTAPSYTKGADVTALENAGATTITAWATQISPGTQREELGQTIAFQLAATNTALFSTQPAVNAAGDLTFTPALNRFGSTTVQIRAKDNGGIDGGGVDSSAFETFVITIDSVNSTPIFTNLSTANRTITRLTNAGNVTVNNWITGLAASSAPNFETWQTVSVRVLTNKPQLYTTLPTVAVTGAGPTFSGNLSFAPNPAVVGSDTLIFIVKDNGGTANGAVDSVAGSFFIVINPYVNVAPTFTVSTANRTITRTSLQTAPQTVTNWATAINPGGNPESSQLTSITITSRKPQMYTAQPAVNIATQTGTNRSGVLTFTLSGIAGTDTLRAVLRDNGGTNFGGVDSSVIEFFIVVNPILNVAPTFTISAANRLIIRTTAQTTVQTISNWATAISPGQTSEASQQLSWTFNSKNPAIYTTRPSATLSTQTGTNRSSTLSFQLNGTSGADTIRAVLKDNGGILNGGTDSAEVQIIIRVDVTGLATVLTQNVKVYPNPSREGRVYLDLSEITEPSRVEVLDLQGRLLMSRVLEGEQTHLLDLSQLPATTYLLRLSNSQGQLIKRLVTE